MLYTINLKLKVDMSNLNKISFSEAKKILKEFRYKPRREWLKRDRAIFKVCNFNVLSRKRVNKILLAILSFGKLNDRSHYTYTEEDIRLVKDLILDNFEQTLKKFNKSINILKESDINDIQELIVDLKNENTRLQKENERLQFIIKDKTKQKEFLVNNEIDKIFGENNENKKQKNLRKRLITRENLDKIKKDWEKGKTISEVKTGVIKEELSLKGTKRKKVKL